VPYPPDYGGVIDLFYKIVTLSQQNIRIHLHCYDYGRGRQEELNKYCESVSYYKRNSVPSALFHNLPYIVSSRINTDLYDALAANDYPILIEGTHCSYLLTDERFRNRKLLFRMHNVEAVYYSMLSRSTSNLLKKLYFFRESRKLRAYEPGMLKGATVFTVSRNDTEHIRSIAKPAMVQYLPVFLPWQKIASMQGIGNYCLYHGNLAVPENQKAVRWLLSEVIDKTGIPLVVAGGNPPSSLKKLFGRSKSVCLVENPSEADMQDMIAKAHVNLLPSFNNTGIKLKLLNALFNGRHCVANNMMIEGTGLDSLCYVSDTAGGFRNTLIELYHKPFEEEEIRLREQLLLPEFDNVVNAQRLIRSIW
jgi:glycosyltransferase involved in cell wall biosynthesis